MKVFPIRYIAPISLANIIAVYYSIGGVANTVVSAIDKPPTSSAPLGLLFPYLSLKINLKYVPSENVAGITFQLLIFAVVYGVSGWLTGFVGASIYNLLSKYFGISVKGRQDQLLSSVANPS